MSPSLPVGKEVIRTTDRVCSTLKKGLPEKQGASFLGRLPGVGHRPSELRQAPQKNPAWGSDVAWELSEKHEHHSQGLGL